MEHFELVNIYTIDCNDGVREVKGRESLLALAQAAGWLNVRREVFASSGLRCN